MFLGRIMSAVMYTAIYYVYHSSVFFHSSHFVFKIQAIFTFVIAELKTIVRCA